MSKLIWRLFKKGFVVQIALTVLLTAAVALFAVYNSYIAGEINAVSGRIENNTTTTGLYRVIDSATQANKNLSTNASLSRYYLFIAAWYDTVTPSSVGHLPITYLDTTHGTLRLGAGVAAIHQNIAARLGVTVGDGITLYIQNQATDIKVTDVYSTTPFNSGIDFGESILVHTGEAQQNKHFLYQDNYGRMTRNTQARGSLTSIHSRGSVMRALGNDPMGAMIVRSNYVTVTQSKFILLLFVALAFLTAKLLSYMDTRRVFAILKALGLHRRQMSAIILGEAMLSPVLGAIFGGALAILILRTLNNSGYNMPISLASVLSAMIMVFPAVAVGALVPARLAQVSTVNELLFERQVPLIRERKDRVARRYPSLEHLTNRGVRLLRINMCEGLFDGFIFHALGSQVQAGEVIALERDWWGLKTVEYVSLIAGTIVYFEDLTGMIGIAPLSHKS